jgi:peroxin-19
MSSAPKAPVKKEEPTKKTSTTCVEEEDPAEQDLDDLLGNDDFAKQLAAGMEQLMGQMGAENNDEMKDAFEKVWASLGDESIGKTSSPAAAAAAAATTTTAAATTATASREVPKVPQSFQETIGKTMNKLKDSSKEIDVSLVCMALVGKLIDEIVIHGRGIRRRVHDRINEANGITS